MEFHILKPFRHAVNLMQDLTPPASGALDRSSISSQILQMLFDLLERDAQGLRLTQKPQRLDRILVIDPVAGENAKSVR
jgi:hypothetical protein